MEKLDLDDAFDAYMRKVNATIPQHSAQYKESRRVFFAGAALMYYHMIEVSDSLTEAAAMAHLADLGDQLKDFYDRVKNLRD